MRRELVSQTASYHINCCRAAAQRQARSATAIFHIQWLHRRLLPALFGGGAMFCLRSKGLTCLETSPGLGSPWVPLSTNKPQRISQPQCVQTSKNHANASPGLPRGPPSSISPPSPPPMALPIPLRQRKTNKTHISSRCWRSCGRARPGARRRRAWRRKKQRDGRTCWRVAEWSLSRVYGCSSKLART